MREVWLAPDDPEFVLARRSRALFERMLDLEAADRSRLVAEHAEPELASLAARLVVNAEERAGPEPVISFAALDIPQLEVGAELGRARITGVLREGVNSRVYRAEHLDTGRRLAVKIVGLPIVAGTVGAREARLLGRLDHPGIVSVLDAGEIASVGDMAHPYVVMPMVEGRTLREWWAGSRGWAMDAARMVLEIGDAVRHAHASLIVHRDLKPSNVLVDAEGRARVLDFGMAAVRGEATHAGGTPAYMAPEQFDGVVDVRVDVYALGAMLHEMVTGRPPVDVDAMDWEEAAAAKRRNAVAPARGIGRELSAVIAKAISIEPEDRYQSVGELCEDLRRAIGGRTVRAAPASGRRRIALSIRRTPWVWGMGATAGLLLVGGVLGVWRQSVRAERNWAVAGERFDLLRDFTGWVVEDLDRVLAEMSGSTAARVAIVDRAIEALDGLRIGEGEDASLRFEVAHARYRLARTLAHPHGRQLGRLAAATEQCALAGELVLPLAGAGRYDATMLLARVRELEYLIGGELGPAAQHTILEEAIDACADAIGSSGGTFDDLAFMAYLRALRTRYFANNGDIARMGAALDADLRAIELGERVFVAGSGGVSDLAWACYYGAVTCDELGVDEALRLAERSERLMVTLDGPGARSNLARAMSVRGDLQWRRGLGERGLARLRSALAILDEEIAAYPDDHSPARAAEVGQAMIADRLLEAALASEGDARRRLAEEGLARSRDVLARYDARSKRGWVWGADVGYGAQYRTRVERFEELLSDI